MQKLDKLQDILQHPSDKTPSKWKAWLRRYTFPRKYVLVMIMTGLLGVMRHPLSQDLIFITLGKYFKDKMSLLAKMQIWFRAMTDTQTGRFITIKDGLKNWFGILLDHKVGLSVGNPVNVHINQTSTNAANKFVYAARSYFNYGMHRCINMAASGAAEIVDNEDIKELLYLDFFNPKYADRFLKYVPGKDRMFSGTMLKQVSLLWAVKVCQLEELTRGSDQKVAMIANECLEDIKRVVLPYLNGA